MIGKLRGVVDSTGPDHIVLDVSGVGYVCYCSEHTLQRLPNFGEVATLVIETHVREEQIRLFGFISESERDWFRLLLTVQGVGTKVALAVLSTISHKDLAMAIISQSSNSIVQVPGVGKKLAERIIIELKDKVSKLEDVSSPAISISTGYGGAVRKAGDSSIIDDAISVLLNLGYPQVQASEAVFGAFKTVGTGVNTEQLIRMSLQHLLR